VDAGFRADLTLPRRSRPPAAVPRMAPVMVSPRARLIGSLAVFLITFAVYAALTPRVEQRLDPLTGDEPFYVMTAHNLLSGRGLDETDSWFNQDYNAFYPPDP